MGPVRPGGTGSSAGHDIRPATGKSGDGAAGPRSSTARRAAGRRSAGKRAATRKRGGSPVLPVGRRASHGPGDQRQRRRSRCPAHSPRPGAGAPAVPAMSSNDGRPVPRSGLLAGRRVAGVPGGRRRRSGAVVPRCCRSAAGWPVVRGDGGDGTAGAPLTPVGRAAGPFGARGTGGDEEAGRFPRSCPLEWWSFRPRPCERCDRCGAIGGPAPGCAPPSLSLISGKSG